VDEAVVHFRKALELQSNHADAHYNLANALLQKGQTDEAMAEFQKALQIAADNIPARNNLAWLLATCPEATVRNGNKAIELAQKADWLSHSRDPEVIGTLAAAYAEAGRFAEAIATVRQAIQVATAQTNAALAGGFQAHLKLYQAGLPLRDMAQTVAPASSIQPGSAH